MGTYACPNLMWRLLAASTSPCYSFDVGAAGQAFLGTSSRRCSSSFCAVCHRLCRNETIQIRQTASALAKHAGSRRRPRAGGHLEGHRSLAVHSRLGRCSASRVYEVVRGRLRLANSFLRHADESTLAGQTSGANPLLHSGRRPCISACDREGAATLVRRYK